MKALALLAALPLLAMSSLASAEAVLSCEEINEMGEALATLSVALDEGGEIGEGTEADNALRGTIDGLLVVADAESDRALASAARNMDRAWHAMDRDGFTGALDSAVGRLAEIAVTECDD